MASKRHQRRKGCTGKRRYLSEQAANHGLWQHTRALGYSGHMHAYKCPWCRGYHIGHPKRRHVRHAP